MNKTYKNACGIMTDLGLMHDMGFPELSNGPF